MDFYALKNGWGTRYFMLYVKEQKVQNRLWIESYINKNNVTNDVTFGILKGKHDADNLRIDGSSAVSPYSDKFIAMLEENGVHNFDRYLLNIDDPEYEIKNKYYYIVPKCEIPYIGNQYISYPNIWNFAKKTI